jgi:4-amino-4-deoxy-L-arabinose transferase-like glycosyltransferase
MVAPADTEERVNKTSNGRLPSWAQATILLFALAFLSLFKIGSVSLFDYDEAIYAQAAREMYETGNWLNPTYTGENFYDKPVLYYWVTILSFKTLGVTELAARLPSSLFGILMVLALLYFVTRVWGFKSALHVSFAFALSLFYAVYSRASVMDMTLTFFIACAIFSSYLSVRQKRAYIYGLYGFSALAFLTKGLIGVLFPFGISGVFLVITEGWSGLRRLFSLRGLLLFLLLAAPWFVAQLIVNGWEFFDQFIIAQHFRRFTGTMQGHKGPIYYYLPVLVLGGFPWIAFFPGGLVRVFKDRSARDLGLLALIWFLAIVGFFSLSRTKLPNYILPAVPAMCIIIASGMDQAISSVAEGSRRVLAILNGCARWFILGLSILMGVAFIVLGRYLPNLGLEQAVWPYFAALALFAMAASMATALSRKKDRHLVSALSMAAFLFILSVGAVPAASRLLQGTLQKYSLYIKNETPREARIISYRLSKPSLVFYSGRFVERFWSMEELRPVLDKKRIPGRQPPLIVVTKAKEVKTLKDAGFLLVDTDGTYVLLKND